MSETFTLPQRYQILKDMETDLLHKLAELDKQKEKLTTLLTTVKEERMKLVKESGETYNSTSNSGPLSELPTTKRSVDWNGF